MRAHPWIASITVVAFVLLQSGCASSGGNSRPAWIDGFSGWAGSSGGVLYARVHKGRAADKPKPHESSCKRLLETVEALKINALEHAIVRVGGIDGVTSATANDHGLIELALPASLRPGPARVTLTIAEPGWQPAKADIVVQVWDDQPGLGVISDIDDTLTDSGVTHKLKLIWNTLFHSEYEVKIFEDAPSVLSKVVGNDASGGAGHPGRALFYLSGSPWGLHERISHAFDREGLPRGVMILRSYSRESLDPFRFKHPHLQELFAAFPHRRWLLFGDTGEKDPEVYAEMRLEHPGSIERIYIHNVTGADPKDARFTDMTLFKDWSEVAKDAEARGYAAKP